MRSWPWGRGGGGQHPTELGRGKRLDINVGKKADVTPAITRAEAEHKPSRAGHTGWGRGWVGAHCVRLK